MNPFRLSLIEALSAHLEVKGVPNADLDAWIEAPKEPQHGQFALPCFRLAKSLKKAPPQIAAEIAEGLALPNGFASADPTGPYLNFKVDRAQYAEWILSAPPAPLPANGKTVVIDYSSPNIAKPFGVGHLRSTVIGSALANLYRDRGWEVVRVNHLGDWGTQFGKLMEAFGRWGDDAKLKERPIGHLYDIYVRFHKEAGTDPGLELNARAWFKKLEEGDAEANALWRRFRVMSLTDFKRIYDLLGVGFDSWDGEAFFNDKMDRVVAELEEKGLLEESDGAMIVDLEAEKLPPCLIKKSDGATLYATRDLAAALYRKETYGFDRLIYVVGAAQQLHFKQVFTVLRKMGHGWAERCAHVDFGLIQGISTRKGTLVFLEEMLDEAIERIGEIVADRDYDEATKTTISRALGIGSVIFNDLSRGRIKDVEFDWERMLALDGDTGPYIQYAQVRAGSILEKAGKEAPESYDASVFAEDETGWALLLLLEEHDRILDQALGADEPSTLSQHLLRLAKAFNRFYFANKVIGSPHENAYLALTRRTQQTLAHGMEILGLERLERM